MSEQVVLSEGMVRHSIHGTQYVAGKTKKFIICCCTILIQSGHKRTANNVSQRLTQPSVLRLFGVSSIPREVPMPYSTFSLSQEPLSSQRRALSGISHGTQTDPINIKVTALVWPILRGLVSLAALHVLATYDSITLFLSDSPALRAILTFCLIRCLRPVLRGIHFLLIWISVTLRILSALVAIITPDPM